MGYFYDGYYVIIKVFLIKIENNLILNIIKKVLLFMVESIGILLFEVGVRCWFFSWIFKLGLIWMYYMFIIDYSYVCELIVILFVDKSFKGYFIYIFVKKMLFYI